MPRAVILILLAACSHGPDTDRPNTLGKERADCRPDKTCDPNLMCLSNLCVRPPPADCQLVADELASFDLGNYAEPETREPVVAKYKQQCDALYITKEEGACLDKAKDRWSASQCAARLFPELSKPGSECAQAGEKTKSSMYRQYRGVQIDPMTKKYLEAAAEAVRVSCTDDKWPAAITTCVLSGDPNQNIFSYGQCSQQLGPLMQKLQERYAQLVQKAQSTP
jgi:hypothetical protein